MSECKEASPFPPTAVAENVGELASNVISLAELQAELFKADTQDCLARSSKPALTICAAIALGVGCVPVGLSALAFGLSELGLPLWIGFLFATLVGAGLAAVLALAGWRRLRHATSMFIRSKTEFDQNIAWLKHTLKNRSAKKQSTGELSCSQVKVN